MDGMDDYLAEKKKEIFTQVYMKHYQKQFDEVTNVVAMKKRKQQEETIKAQLISSLKKKIEQAAAQKNRIKMVEVALKQAAVEL